MIDDTLNFKAQFNKVDLKTKSALAQLYSIKRLLTDKVMRTLLNSYVFSISDYVNTVWAIQTDKILSKIQNRVDRFLVNFNFPKLCKFKLFKNTFSQIKIGSNNKDKVKAKVNKSKNKNKILVNSIYSIGNKILTLIERRNVNLIKLVWKNLKIGFPGTENWFNIVSRSNRGTVPRLVVVRCNKEIRRQSVQHRAILEWNKLPKDWDFENLSLNSFVKKFKDKILNERDDIFC